MLPRVEPVFPCASVKSAAHGCTYTKTFNACTRLHEKRQIWKRADVVRLLTESPQCIPINRSPETRRYESKVLKYTQNTVSSASHPTQVSLTASVVITTTLYSITGYSLLMDIDILFNPHVRELLRTQDKFAAGCLTVFLYPQVRRLINRAPPDRGISRSLFSNGDVHLPIVPLECTSRR